MGGLAECIQAGMPQKLFMRQAANDGFGWAGWAEALAASLTNLEDLRVGGAAASDFDVLALRALTNLSALDLSDSPDVSI